MDSEIAQPFIDLWLTLELWQQITVGILTVVWIALSSYGAISGKVNLNRNSIFEKDTLKLAGIGAILMLVVFIAIPYLVF